MLKISQYSLLYTYEDDGDDDDDDNDTYHQFHSTKFSLNILVHNQLSLNNIHMKIYWNFHPCIFNIVYVNVYYTYTYILYITYV